MHCFPLRAHFINLPGGHISLRQLCLGTDHLLNICRFSAADPDWASLVWFGHEESFFFFFLYNTTFTLIYAMLAFHVQLLLQPLEVASSFVIFWGIFSFFWLQFEALTGSFQAGFSNTISASCGPLSSLGLLTLTELCFHFLYVFF